MVGKIVNLAGKIVNLPGKIVNLAGKIANLAKYRPKQPIFEGKEPKTSKNWRLGVYSPSPPVHTHASVPDYMDTGGQHRGLAIL